MGAVAASKAGDCKSLRLEIFFSICKYVNRPPNVQFASLKKHNVTTVALKVDMYCYLIIPLLTWCETCPSCAVEPSAGHVGYLSCHRFATCSPSNRINQRVEDDFAVVNAKPTFEPPRVALFNNLIDIPAHVVDLTDAAWLGTKHGVTCLSFDNIKNCKRLRKKLGSAKNWCKKLGSDSNFLHRCKPKTARDWSRADSSGKAHDSVA